MLQVRQPAIYNSIEEEKVHRRPNVGLRPVDNFDLTIESDCMACQTAMLAPLVTHELERFIIGTDRNQLQRQSCC